MYKPTNLEEKQAAKDAKNAHDEKHDKEVQETRDRTRHHAESKWINTDLSSVKE